MINDFVAWLLLLVHALFINFLVSAHTFGLVRLQINNFFASLLLEYLSKRGVAD